MFMKHLFICLGLVLSSAFLYAEDIIITRTSEKISATIEEVGPDYVKYHTTSNPNGPLFRLEANEIATIIYGNGEVQSFEQTQTQAAPNQPNSMMVQSTAVPAYARAKAPKTFDYKKSKQLRDAGISLTIVGGATMFLIGAPMIAAAKKYDTMEHHAESSSNWSLANKYEEIEYRLYDAHQILCSVGLVSLISGIPMLAVGSHRMKYPSAPQLAIGGTKDGLGMRLTF